MLGMPAANFAAFHVNHNSNKSHAAYLLTLFVIGWLLGFPLAAEAQVHVRGYFRKNGTYVQPHYRSAPDGNPYNNYSYPGNLNPYTGEVATGDPSTYLNNYYNRQRIAPSPSDRVGLSGINVWFPVSTTPSTRRATAATQVALGVLGEFNDVVDGRPGPRTRAALVSFQERSGLPGTGQLDNDTAEALIDALQKLPADSPAFARQFTVEPAAPSNASPSPYGAGWVCNHGFKNSAGSCIAVEIPANAQLDVYGHDWECVRGFRRSGAGCAMVDVPVHGQLNVYGNDWECSRGFRRSGNGCGQVGIPENAQLNVYGNDWECSRGYRRSSYGCTQVSIPQYAQLNVYGNDWECSRGYRRSGMECARVAIPENGKLNVYGNDWECSRGYRRSGSGCVAVTIPENGQLNVYGNDWECSRGFRRSGYSCTEVPVPENAQLDVYGHDWQCNRGFRRSGNSCVAD
jgi:hypothetical protein